MTDNNEKYKVDRLDFYQKMYFYELDERQKIIIRLGLILVSNTLTLNFIRFIYEYGVLKKLDYSSISYWCQFLGVIAITFMIMYSLACIFLSFSCRKYTTYREMPYLIDIDNQYKDEEEYTKKINEFNQFQPIYQKQAEIQEGERFYSYLIKHLKRNTTENAKVNTKRKKIVHQAFVGAGLGLLFSVILLVCVLLLNIFNERDNNMSENEDNKKPSTTNPQSTKPEPPRERGSRIVTESFDPKNDKRKPKNG